MTLYNRDLSWLGFNNRVLQEAANAEVPLYERLKFLAIFSSNLDEFFRVRYPSVLAFSKLDKKTIRKETLLSKEDVGTKVHEFIDAQLNIFGKILKDELISGLLRNNVNFYYGTPIDGKLASEVKQIFLAQVLSFIQPVFLSEENLYKFSPVNGDIYFIITLLNKGTTTISHVILNIPSGKLKRFYTLGEIDAVKQVVFIDDIIRENLNLIFPGQTIQSVYSIKFNRNAALPKTEEYSSNLLDKIEKTLSGRDKGEATRLLFEKGMPANLQLYLAQSFGIQMDELFEGGRYHNLSDLFTFPNFDKSLYYEHKPPILYPADSASGDIFYLISKKDILLHLPYNSYIPVLCFFNQAAVDVDVTEIFITLYRVATESHIVNALISAAKNGKKVTAFIELKARFDEANNIKWSRVMKEAGIKLIYSDPDIKIHSKIALVKRKEGKNKRLYGILCTGNFNENTALFYTDHVLLTVDKKICSEMQMLFYYLKKKKYKSGQSNIKFKSLFVSKFNLVDDFEDFINQEIKKVEEGNSGLLRIKVNNLEEPNFINLLYKASNKGVKIQLIVRSICCLIPGVPGQSENITVRRIVDKYLEHTRLFIFGVNEDVIVALGSSDLMTRNLYNRIEVCTPVKEKVIRAQLMRYFDIQWEDNVKATQLDSEMHQHKIRSGNMPVEAQQKIYSYLSSIQNNG